MYLDQSEQLRRFLFSLNHVLLKRQGKSFLGHLWHKTLRPAPPIARSPSLAPAPPTPIRKREAPALQLFVPRGDPSSRWLWRPPWRRVAPEERPGWAGGLQPREAEATSTQWGRQERAGTLREARRSECAPAAELPLLAPAPTPAPAPAAAADMAGGHCGSFAASAASSGEIVQLNVGGTR